MQLHVSCGQVICVYEGRPTYRYMYSTCRYTHNNYNDVHDIHVHVHVCMQHNMHMHGLIVSLFCTDPTLTLKNISTVTATVPLESDELGESVLRVLDGEREEIRQQSSTATEERERLICYYLNYSEYASWGHLAGRLYCRQHHDALSAARRFIKTEPGEFVCNNVNQ